MSSDQSKMEMAPMSVSAPGYNGPDRRRAPSCPYYDVHERVMGEHEKDIDRMREDCHEIKKNTDDRFERMEDRHHKEVDKKLPAKTFWILFSSFAGLYLLATAANFTGIYYMKEGINERISEVVTEVKVLKAAIEYQSQTSNRIEKQLNDVDEKVDKHMFDTNGRE